MSFQNFKKAIISVFKPSKNEPPKGAAMKMYSFIWYRKMEHNGETIYTQPFRTKIMAESYEKAREKAINFAMRKQELVVTTEDEFVKSDLYKLRSFFDRFQLRMNSLFDMLEKTHRL